MSHNDDELMGEQGFKTNLDNLDEPLDPLEDGAMNDFRFDEDADEDPDKDH